MTCLRFSLLAAVALSSAILQKPISAQEIGEPDPFRVIGEKDGDAAPITTVESEEPKISGAPKPLSAQISQHILKLAQEERQKRLKFMAVVIDDVSRLCDLDYEQREQLELAAKGTAERSMKDWHQQAERYFRTRLEGADTDTAKEMLESMGNVNFGGNRSEEEGESLDLWKDTLKVVLTDEQVAQYEKVVEERHLNRIDAFSKMSLTSIDSHLRLTPDQRTEIGQIVHEAATEYLDDIQRYWGDYFERGMLMSLANAQGDEQLKEILTEDQFERLQEATTNFDHFWEQKIREKKARAKAAKMREEKAAEDANQESREAKARARAEELRNEKAEEDAADDLKETVE